ncbi:MAG: NYN domain-containing protein [Clostridia bacterium]|nr:NYN domain-containing protein [Clostridia bacterium]
MKKIAILVDGGFYKKRAKYLFGDKTPEERANELVEYCMRHIKEHKHNDNELYRIFYYDCMPSEKNVYHPLTQKAIDLKKAPIYTWNKTFFNELITKRKVALRMGELLESSVGYNLKEATTKKLCRKEISVDDLTDKDFELDIQQKGVDMRIGLDIASLAYKKLVDRIVLIAGDSDFVPAAKHARREGIDFILDPLWQQIKPSLMEHIDGLQSKTPLPGSGTDPLKITIKK